MKNRTKGVTSLAGLTFYFFCDVNFVMQIPKEKKATMRFCALKNTPLNEEKTKVSLEARSHHHFPFLNHMPSSSPHP